VPFDLSASRGDARSMLRQRHDEGESAHDTRDSQKHDHDQEPAAAEWLPLVPGLRQDGSRLLPTKDVAKKRVVVGRGAEIVAARAIEGGALTGIEQLGKCLCVQR